MFRLTRKGKRPMSDEELILRYRESDDPEIIAELYDRYVHLVYGVCLKYLKDREQSKDAVMEIFEKILTDLDRQKIKNFQGWLYVVARNFCLMKLRKSKKQIYIEWIDMISQDNFMENHMDMHLINKDNDEGLILGKCMQELPESQRKCIELFYYKEKCYKEIAEITNYDLKKVKSHIQNGKRNLKICMENNNAGIDAP